MGETAEGVDFNKNENGVKVVPNLSLMVLAFQ